MSEYDPKFHVNLPLAQGDVFAWPRHGAQDDWKQFGIIMTADCDILHRNLEFLTYLPILPVQPYLEQVWVKQKIAKLLFSHQRMLVETIHRYHKRINQKAEELEPKTLSSWIIGSSDEDIFAGLELQDQKETKNLANAVKIYRELIKAENNSGYTSLINSYCEIRALKTNITLEKAIESVSGDARSEVGRNMPLEYFFLSALPQIENLGFIVMLRHIQPIGINQITNSFAEAQRSSRAYRLGRLSPTFKYALTQRFANLFARIGLPGEAETWNDTVVEERCNEIIRKANRERRI